MYQPKPGDRVTVTRQAPNGRRSSETGIYQPAQHVDAFTLDGSWLAGIEFTLRHNGVIQTIAPAPAREDAQ